MFLGQLGESRTGITFLITISLLILNYFVKNEKQVQYLHQPSVPKEVRNFLWPLLRRGLQDCLMPV